MIRVIQLGCAGALLSYVARLRTSAGELDGEGFEVRGLELLKLNKVMQINADALTALQIFADESHASTHSSASKEGLSLFGITNLARTPLGRSLMKQWFLRPSLELDVIECRQDAVECFLRSENQHVVDAMQANLKHIKNVPRLLKTLGGGRGGVQEWQTMWSFLYGTIMIRDAALNLVHGKVAVVEKLLASYDPASFKEMGGMITDIIDWEECALQKGRICVRSGVDADLDEWKRQLNGLPSLLTKIATAISHTLDPSIGVEELSVVYFPQLGYLLTIPVEPDVMDAGKYGSVGWDFQFITESRAYFKSDKCYDLDKHVGDLSSFVAVHALAAALLRLSPQLHEAAEAISELDCLIAFAETTRLYGWSRPVVVEEPVCEIVEGRHPLAELCVEAFVRNGTSLIAGQGDPSSPFSVAPGEDVKPHIDLDKKAEELEKNDTASMIVVTGANFSGKSIYLKQVALIVFLAHIGCYVPAETAIIGLTDRILTRVSTRESVTRGSSAFMIDLQQVSFILRNLTPSSLVLLDEFGKGTESNDGAGLFCGVLEWIVGLGKEMPRTIVATHFQHVFLNGLISRQLPGVKLAHMEVLVQEDQGSEKTAASSAVEKLTYLYRLQPGLTTSSNAASCALLFGLPAPVVARATYISHLVSSFQIDALSIEEETEEERREVQEGERVGRGLLMWDLSSIDEEADGDTVEEMRERLRRLLDGVEEMEEE
ncbi:hypothetical protein JCM11251_001834 [Rhodosporidiobolus azoricus]